MKVHSPTVTAILMSPHSHGFRGGTHTVQLRLSLVPSTIGIKYVVETPYL